MNESKAHREECRSQTGLVTRSQPFTFRTVGNGIFVCAIRRQTPDALLSFQTPYSQNRIFPRKNPATAVIRAILTEGVVICLQTSFSYLLARYETDVSSRNR